MPTTHANITLNVLMYASELLAENDLHAIMDLGFRLEQVRRLQRLSMGDVLHLSQIPGHSLAVRIDARSIDHLLDHIERSRETVRLQNELLRCGACQDMMRTLYGILPHEYAVRRKLLGISSTGRPPQLSEAEEKAILQAWRDSSGEPDPGARYLALAYQFPVPLSAIWRLVESVTDPAPSGHADKDTAHAPDNVVTLKTNPKPLPA